MFGIGDRKAADLPGSQRRFEPAHGRVNLQRRIIRGEQDNASDGVEHSAVLGSAAGMEFVHEILIRRHEQLEWRALQDLLEIIAR